MKWKVRFVVELEVEGADVEREDQAIQTAVDVCVAKFLKEKKRGYSNTRGMQVILKGSQSPEAWRSK